MACSSRVACLALISLAACFPSSVDLSGKTCNAQGQCATGYACVAGTCVKSGTAGTPCLGDADCSSDLACRSGACGEKCVAPACECDPGQTQACGLDRGICMPGTQTCGSDQHWSACIGGVSATNEVCNGKDDDCDGVADDGPGMVCVQNADAGPCVDACGTMGTYACNATCDGFTQCAPPPEICNGKDDDCDGVVDNGFTCAQGSDAGSCVTSCGTSGHRSCNTTCDGYVCAATEICNGKDDDCDGVVDNGLNGAAQGVAGPGAVGSLALATSPSLGVALYTRQGAPLESVEAQLLNSALGPVGSPVLDNAQVDQSSPAVVALAGNAGFTLAWVQGGAVLALPIDASGGSGVPTQVSADADRAQSVALAATVDGGTAFAWQNMLSDGGSNVVVRILTDTGPEQVIDAQGSAPAVATGPNGDVAVAYLNGQHLAFKDLGDASLSVQPLPASTAPALIYDPTSASFIVSWAVAGLGAGGSTIKCLDVETGATGDLAAGLSTSSPPKLTAGNGFIYAAWSDTGVDGGLEVRMARIDANCSVVAGPQTVASGVANPVLAFGGTDFTVGFTQSAGLSDGGVRATLEAQNICF